MKKYILAIITTLFMSQSFAINIGGLAVTVSFCQNIQKLGSIVNSYTQVQWPTGGAVGVTQGVLQNTSAVMVMCDYIMKLESLNTTQAIFYTASTLNDMTGKKWDAHLQQADRTFNIAHSLYDFEKGDIRKGALESASTHRELNEYIKETRQWSSKTFNGEDADVRTRAQRENDMQRFAGVAYQRAIIKEMVSCPEPTDDKNYAEIYKNKIKPLEKQQQRHQEDYMFFKERLLFMGPKFMGNDKEMQEYIALIEKMENNGVWYDPETIYLNEETVKVSQTAKGSDGYPLKEKQTLKREAQVFTAKTTDSIFNDFKSKYAESWKSFVAGQIIGNGISGILDDPTARFQRDFVNLNYECQDRRLMEGIDSENRNYYQILEQKKAECIAKVKMDQKQAESLISYYTNKLKDSLFLFKQTNAKIWTIESKELKRTRVVTKSTAGNFQQEQVSCSQSLTPAEMDKLMLKQQSVSNELNEMLVKEAIKQNIREEEEKKQRDKINQEMAIRTMVIEEKAKRREKERNTVQQISAPRGGIGVKK